ncbi:MFS transporter [Verrucomicrobia bacterium]|jgi:MFS family permease|nr:MFS transporter [Verrucomicrobiota bacterium]MDB4746205.1 MFS transporter [Verrucomicrobiota bacterium]MDB4798264.1 MFS transporter [Verrucomicrobiota bacterium]
MSLNSQADQSHSGFLVWCGVLHAFTHSFHVVLMPLYLPIQRDFGFESVAQATLLMSVLMISYFLPSYVVGSLADRYDRRLLLGVGLVINGIGFVGLGMSSSYEWALLGTVVAGVGGSFYHPAATALISQLYSTQQGRAFGVVGIGANVGFLGVPIYAGWRVDQLSGQVGDAAWRTPVLELGWLAIIVAIVFLIATRHWRIRQEHSHIEHLKIPLFVSRKAWGLFLIAALAFSFRDFAGMGMGSLGSLFLQKAHGFSAAATGAAVSAIFLAAIISNPLFGKLSDHHRYGWIAFVMSVAGFCVLAYPYLPRWGLIPGLIVYGFFFMACYPMIEAALMESVPSAVRGRVFGLFILISGLLGNLSHWWIGRWVQDLGSVADQATAYRGAYLGLASLVWISMIGLICLRMIRSLSPTSPMVSSADSDANAS